MVAVLVAAGVLAIVRPWTVVPIDTATTNAFDPSSYVASIWPSRVVAAAEAAAVDVQALAAAARSAAPAGVPPRRALFVKGSATIVEIDRRSRVGLARLKVRNASVDRAVAIQIGPVLRGTALRDALDFVRFTDFVNQIEFAAVANALNDRVTADVLAPVNWDAALAGREVQFVGAVPVAGSGAALEMVPVRLQIGGGAP
jgi:predicted lipoprotein